MGGGVQVNPPEPPLDPPLGGGRHGIRNILTSTLNTLDMESSERLLACCNSLFRRSSRGLESAGDDGAIVYCELPSFSSSSWYP